MMKKFLKYFAFGAAIAALASSPVFAQSEGATTQTKTAAKPAKKVAPVVDIYFDGTPWKVNYPRALYERKDRRLVPVDARYARIVEKTGGYEVLRTEKKNGVAFESYKKLSDAQKIKWPANDPLLADAQAEIARGNASGALGIAERFLTFFAPLKSTEGSPWLRAAVIKLDALDLQENDAVLDSFIREIEAAPNYSEIEGLSTKIKLARLFQLVRKGEYAQVLESCNEMMKGSTDVEMLARLHIVKGDALYNLSRYEDALKVYLRIPVFYGNQSAFMPKAKLAISKCLLRMDRPDTKAMKLAARSEEYALEVISEYPMAPEAKKAFEELPKHKRDEIAAAGTIEDKAAARAAVTAKIDAENAAERGEDDAAAIAQADDDAISVAEETDDDDHE